MTGFQSYASEGKYLKADEFEKNARVNLTIAEIAIEAIEDRQLGKKQQKAVVYFDDWPRKYKGFEEKGLILNVTNTNTLVDAFGDETEACADKSIVLVRVLVEFSGKKVPGLRLEIPSKYTETVSGEEPSPEIDDDPPF